jgi:hypothetical protein
LGRSGSGANILNMATPMMDNYSPNTFLVSGNNNVGNQSSNGSNGGPLSGLIGILNSPFGGLGLTNTPPFD